MTRHGMVCTALMLGLVLGLGGVPQASAQTATPGVLHRIEGQYWFATATGPGTSVTAGMFQFQYALGLLASPWAFQAQYLGGGGMGEAFWTVDALYRLRFDPIDLARGTITPPWSLSLKASYGSFRWTAGGGTATSSGFGIGTEATARLRELPGGGRLYAMLDYVIFPGNATTAVGGSGSGPASTWAISVHFKAPRKTAHGPVPGTTYVSTLGDPRVMGSEWDFAAGYRDVMLENPNLSTYRWTGFFIGFGKTF